MLNRSSFLQKTCEMHKSKIVNNVQNLSQNQINRYEKIKQMQQSNNSLGLSKVFVHISLNNIEIRHNNKFEDIYFSFIHKERFHFSSAISSKTTYINDDFFLFFQTEQQIPEVLKIQRWEKHMILLENQIDITELKGRSCTKKKVETKQNEIISLTINLHNSEQIKFIDRPVASIVQHYLKIFKLSLKDTDKQAEEETLSYFQIFTKQQKYIVPVINSELVIQLSCEIQISYYKNHQLFGKSDWFSSDQLKTKALQIGLYNQKGSYVSKLKLHSEWGTNLSERKLQSSILYQAHELCIYDIEVKFQNFAQLAGAKLKFVYGTKFFQVNGELNHRIVQFQRIIYIILKSEDEQIAVYCQKNNKIIAQARFNTAEMLSHRVIMVKKLFTDLVSHRPLGYIRFSCQKAKNLSLPSSNSFWKQCNKKKNSTKLILQIQQLSVYCQTTKQLCAVVKTQKEQYQIQPIINFQNFQLQNSLHEPIALSIQQQTSVYILIKQKKQQNAPENQFLGIASINYEELRLGINSVKIPFFKNQIQTLSAHCIINKVVPYPFVKGVTQTEVTVFSHLKNLMISATIERIEFQPYFLTYEYECKNQVYCIFQIGKIKKVIILQSAGQNKLIFGVSNASDLLNYNLLESDFIKGKMTFLVSQFGIEEQIYGYATVKLKTSQLLQNQSQKFKNLQIKNEQGICIGNISLQIKKGSVNSSQMLSNRELKKIKNEMIKVNDNIQKVQRKITKNKSLVVQNHQLADKKSIKNERKPAKKEAERQDGKQFPVRYVSKKKTQVSKIKLPKI